jgi:hypothetical protein
MVLLTLRPYRSILTDQVFAQLLNERQKLQVMVLEAYPTISIIPPSCASRGNLRVADCWATALASFLLLS